MKISLVDRNIAIGSLVVKLEGDLGLNAENKGGNQYQAPQ
jgi:hypothetical protein